MRKAHNQTRISPSMPAPTPPLRGALRIPEAAAYIGVNRTRIYEMIKRAECRSFHLGRAHLVSVRELDRIIAEREEAEAS